MKSHSSLLGWLLSNDFNFTLAFLNFRSLFGSLFLSSTRNDHISKRSSQQLLILTVLDLLSPFFPIASNNVILVHDLLDLSGIRPSALLALGILIEEMIVSSL